MVEADRDVAGDLDVLPLVFAHRHLVGVVQQDVGCLQRRVGEEPGGDELCFTLGRLVLELGHAAELAEADGALHHPGQLAVLGHVALHEDGGHIGVEADGEQHRGQFHRGRAERVGAFGDGERVQIDDAVEGVVLVLSRHPVAQRTQVVAEVHFAGGLDAGEHACHGGHNFNPKTLPGTAVRVFFC